MKEEGKYYRECYNELILCRYPADYAASKLASALQQVSHNLGGIAISKYLRTSE